MDYRTVRDDCSSPCIWHRNAWHMMMRERWIGHARYGRRANNRAAWGQVKKNPGPVNNVYNKYENRWDVHTHVMINCIFFGEQFCQWPQIHYLLYYILNGARRTTGNLLSALYMHKNWEFRNVICGTCISLPLSDLNAAPNVVTMDRRRNNLHNWNRIHRASPPPNAWWPNDQVFAFAMHMLAAILGESRSIWFGKLRQLTIF